MPRHYSEHFAAQQTVEVLVHNFKALATSRQLVSFAEIIKNINFMMGKEVEVVVAIGMIKCCCTLAASR